MNLYGPSAATGLTGAAGVMALSHGNMLYTGLALFTLTSAVLAVGRILPSFRRRNQPSGN